MSFIYRRVVNKCEVIEICCIRMESNVVIITRTSAFKSAMEPNYERHSFVAMKAHPREPGNDNKLPGEKCDVQIRLRTHLRWHFHRDTRKKR